MRIADLSELHLAAIIAAATLAGSLLSSIFGAVFMDAGTAKQTDVQLIELAIGILSEPPLEGETDRQLAADVALRSWAVDTINSAAPISFDNTAKQFLVRGKAQLLRQTMTVDGVVIEASPRALDYLMHQLYTRNRQMGGRRMIIQRGPNVESREAQPSRDPSGDTDQ